MSFVGGGQGEYVQEVTYKFVGLGAGDFEVIEMKRPVTCSCCFVGLGVVVVLCLLLIVLLLLPGPLPTTTWPSFDCEAGWANWQREWSDQKKMYCCKEVGRGCSTPTPPPVVPTPAPFDCNAGWANWQTGWSEAKKVWCCQSQGKGCTRNPGPGPSPRVCLIWGDPHIDAFDAPAHADFFFEGEVWIVKSASVHIQARYRATPFTNGLAATKILAIGGPFMRGHVLKVGPMETGDITWDLRPVLTEFPSTFDLAGLGTAAYNGEGRLVDNAQAHLERHIVHVDLPEGVHVQIMRWSHHINVRITMPGAAGGQDGHCGNFNNDASDDTTGQILARIGNSIPPEECLFRTCAPATPMKRLSLDDCSPEQRGPAQKQCEQARPGITGRDLNACIFDVCFAGQRYAAQDADY